MSLLLNDKMAMRQPIIGMLRRHLPSFAQPRGLTARACFSSMRFGGPAVLPCSPSSPPSLGRLHGGMLCPHPPMPERQAHRSSSVAHPPRLAAPRPAAATRSDFFLAEEGTTFSSVGFPPPVVEAIHRVGFPVPSQIQADSAMPLLAGKTAVIAAETGCGKTLAYLAPIMTLMLRQRQQYMLMNDAWLAEQRKKELNADATVDAAVQRWVGGGRREGCSAQGHRAPTLAPRL